MILAGDIGGTNTRLALVDAEGDELRIAAEKTFPSRERASLEAAVGEFLALHPCDLTRATIGIAGPVRNGRCEATNLPWVVDAKSLAKRLRLERVGLINDLEANAYGVALLRAKDFVVLNRGARSPRGNMAVISAGTGLGEAGMYWDGTRHRPFATEGGHVDFAPRSQLEMELLEYSMSRYRRVSWERLISGPGLVNIYQFLRDTGKKEEPSWLAEEMRHGDAAPVITRNALEGNSPLCLQALEVFVSLYGAEAGNLALKLLATGGVVLGGGIAPRIISKLKEPEFMNAFTAKGRMKPLLQDMPVRVIMNPRTALLGAARHAALDAE
ncbi:MAG: glucokinase [Syntrophobacteraceae bacterium]|jgi:glucokinase|nr:glucokinase [Syntrophobacteraceae bacterium]